MRLRSHGWKFAPLIVATCLVLAPQASAKVLLKTSAQGDNPRISENGTRGKFLLDPKWLQVRVDATSPENDQVIINFNVLCYYQVGHNLYRRSTNTYRVVSQSPLVKTIHPTKTEGCKIRWANVEFQHFGPGSLVLKVFGKSR